MRLSIAVLSIFFASFASAQDQTMDELQLGCVLIDTDAPGIELDPWDAWQSWCDLDTEQPEVLCFQWSGDGWEETSRFQLANILERLEAGARTCPSTPDATPPLPRG